MSQLRDELNELQKAQDRLRRKVGKIFSGEESGDGSDSEGEEES